MEYIIFRDAAGTIHKALIDASVKQGSDLSNALNAVCCRVLDIVKHDGLEAAMEAITHE